MSNDSKTKTDATFEAIDRGQSLGQRILLRRRHMVNLAADARQDVASGLGFGAR